MADAGVAAAVVANLRAHPGNESLQAAGCAVLYSIADCSLVCAQSVASVGGNANLSARILTVY
jgi:hypothetical protein